MSAPETRVLERACSKKSHIEMPVMTGCREDGAHVFLHAGQRGAHSSIANGAPFSAANDLNHVNLNVRGRTYDSLNAERKSLGVDATGYPGEDGSIHFRDPDRHRLQLVVPAVT